MSFVLKINKINEPSCLYSPAAEHHGTLAGTHFPSAEGRRLSGPGWLGEILRWFARPKKVTHPRRPKIELETSTRLPSHRRIADCTFLKVIAVWLLLFIFWATVTTNGSPYAIGPLSCPLCSACSVCLVYRGQTPNGWMDQDATLYGSRPRLRRYCAKWGPSSYQWQETQQPPLSAHTCCGQAAGWIRIPLGTEVGLGAGDTVLDGDPDPSSTERGTAALSAHVYCGQTVDHLATAELMYSNNTTTI